MFAPYLLFAKIAAIVALIAGVAFGAHQITEHWRDQGRAEMQIKLDDRDIIIQHLREDAAEEAKNKTINEGIIDEYHKELLEADAKHLADIAAINKRGGLRVPTPPCRGPTAETEAASAGGVNGETSTRLPGATEQSLYDLASDRDKVITEHTALQNWAVEHGFYPADKYK